MSDSDQKDKSAAVGRLLALLFGLPWIELVANAWKLGRKLWRGLADEGMYEVLEHEVTLELQDRKGVRALVRKRQKVRYLQNNIIAYQDQGWGHGKIFINYKCTPGEMVDRYRAGHKDIILISLREVKKRGDIDEFNIEWEQLNGFLHNVEEWASEVNHRTRHFKIQVIFPRSRPPHKVSLAEHLRRRTRPLKQEAVRKLPDNRWVASWETDKPRLHENYSLKWEW